MKKSNQFVKKIISVISIVILILQAFNIDFDIAALNDILIAISSCLALFGIVSTPLISKQLTDIFGINFKDFNLEEFLKKVFKKEEDNDADIIADNKDETSKKN
jgi:uncharacterized membrane protein